MSKTTSVLQNDRIKSNLFIPIFSLQLLLVVLVLWSTGDHAHGHVRDIVYRFSGSSGIVVAWAAKCSSGLLSNAAYMI